MKTGTYRLMRFKWVAILAVLAMVAVACGDDTADEAPATQATQAPATEATQAATTATTAAMTEEPAEEMDEEDASEEMTEEEMDEEEPESTLATEGTTTTVAPGLVRPQVLEDIPFVFSNIAQTASLDPAVAWSSDGMLFVRSAYDTLLEYPPGSQPAIVQPALASEWSTEDGLTYTFTLRDDVNFHDGNSFDSTDVGRAWSGSRPSARVPPPPSGTWSATRRPGLTRSRSPSASRTRSSPACCRRFRSSRRKPSKPTPPPTTRGPKPGSPRTRRAPARTCSTPWPRT